MSKITSTNTNHKLTAIILTFNEEENIGRCLESIQSRCHVIIVDSFSSDKTLDIASKFGVEVIQHAYENHCAQWNWVLDNVEIHTEWIFALDADFVITQDLWHRIELFLATEEVDYNGFYVIHRYVFWGQPIRFGGIKRYWLVGLRKGCGRGDESDMVDFRFNVTGKTRRIPGKFVSSNVNDSDISFWMRKQDKFSLRLAVEEEMRNRNLLNWSGKKSLMGNTDEKFKVYRDAWMRLPLFIRPILFFIYRYFIALGFLDGIGGFLYHFQQGLWFRMIVDMKIYEIRNNKLSDEKLIAVSKAMLTSKSGSLREILKSMDAVHVH